MARSLGLNVVAEGVETAAQLAVLSGFGCDHAQGFLLARPMPLEQLVTLLSDESKSMLEAYGVWAQKSMYGRTYMGVERTTFLIDASGKIARVWNKVKVPGHAAEVLEAVRAG